MEDRYPNGTITPLEGDLVSYCPLCCFIRSVEGHVIAVDPWQWVKLRKYEWHTKKSRGGIYAYRRQYRKDKPNIIYMHRKITNATDVQQVHHKNGLNLDNREINLVNLATAEHEDLHKIKKLIRKGTAA